MLIKYFSLPPLLITVSIYLWPLLFTAVLDYLLLISLFFTGLLRICIPFWNCCLSGSSSRTNPTLYHLQAKQPTFLLEVSSLKVDEALGRKNLWCKIYFSWVYFSFLPSSCFLCLAQDSINFSQVSYNIGSIPLRREWCLCELWALISCRSVPSTDVGPEKLYLERERDTFFFN